MKYIQSELINCEKKLITFDKIVITEFINQI